MYSILGILFKILFSFMCIGVLPECMSVYRVHAWKPQRAGKGARASGTRLAGGYEPPCW